MEMQALLQQAREMLASQGAPITTENLNRAMLAMAQNQSAPADGFDMNAQVDRVMQRSTGRPSAARPAAAAPIPTAEASPAATAPGANIVAERAAQPPEAIVAAEPAAAVPIEVVAEPVDRLMAVDGGSMADQPPAPPRNVRLENSAQANQRRRGTINTAQPFTDESAGDEVLARTTNRQAVDVDNPTGLALGLMTAPLGAVARGATMAPTIGQRTLGLVQADRAATAAQAGRDAVRANQRTLADKARSTIQRDRAGNPAQTASTPTQGAGIVPPRGGSSAPVQTPQTPNRTVTVGKSDSAPMSAPPMIPPQVVSQNTMAVNQSSAFRAAMERALRNGDAATQQRLLEAARAGAVR
ncbi:hypothetical protein UFOVP810_35 [uncultured Caudovirales phage]|uniref:Uncharacterized protein n=1 Tax=uncultured Caudovirales phage TaxID=2100421 RepID=A0A6J5P2L9_9CAUD|nr:hypothetical protein UFOVP810_35 [uncultured Caudovirales phage]